MKSCYIQGDEPVPGFRLVSFLGAGPLSQVWRASGPGGTPAALKIIRLNGQPALKELAAVQRFKQIRHPHLVPLIAYWLKDEKGKLSAERPARRWLSTQPRAVDLIIAMGLGDKSLSDRLRECNEQGEPGIPRDELLSFLGDAAQAIDYLNQPVHDLGSGPVAIVHCDIKPQNILIAGNAAQVCDLGIARVLGELRTTAPVGSAAYIAPEMLLQSNPSPATDQYSLAISYYELRTGHLPFQAQSVAGAYFTHLQGKLELDRLPEAERAIIARATAVRPEQRFPNCAALVHALKRVRGCRALVRTRPAKQGHESVPLCERVGTKASDADQRHGVAKADQANSASERTWASLRTPAWTAGRRRPSRWRVTLPLLVLAGAVMGSLGAWLTRPSAVAVGLAPAEGLADPPAALGPFVVESSASAFATLAAAIAAAQDGDTVTIHGHGPFALRPLQVQGKALTLRAAPGFRPLLQWAGAPRGPSWQPLLATDRPLTLEGLDLFRDDHDLSCQAGAPAHLVWSQQALLRMLDCRVRARHGSATVVCRKSPAVELRNCALVAHALALSVEAADEVPSAIQLTSNRIALEDPEGTALCVYASELQRNAQARLLLENNTVRAGQLATFKGLPGGVQIAARGNEISVRRAVLGFLDFPKVHGWRHASSWQGAHNRYTGPADWIQVDGLPAGVRDLRQWRALWDSPETGSSSARFSKP